MIPLKKTTYLILLLMLTYSCAVQQGQSNYTQDQPVNFQVFYDELSPYGQWVDYSNYGYVWIPDVRREFAPYATNGHWVMTDYGWTWVSDYRWGWAPFHYGRWDYDDYYGWFWVPDNQWGPAWVTWRGGNGYYGWAPMRPGMNINDSYNDTYRDIDRWHFVRDRDFGSNNMDRYYIDRGNYTTIINNSTVINNTTVDRRRNATYIAGPAENNVQRATGRNINRVRIQDNERPGEKLGNKELKIYRPQVERTDNRRSAPPKVSDIREIKPVRERGTGNSGNSVVPIGNNGSQRSTDQLPQRQRRRTNQQPAGQQQPVEKSTQIPQRQTSRPEVTPAEQQQQNEQRRMEREERQRIQGVQRQNRQMEQNRQGVNQQPSTVQPPASEQKDIQQEQQVRQDRTKQEQLQKQQQLQIQQQQRQIERQQQQLERQQQMQRRRQERQVTRQQQQIEKSQPIPSSQPVQQQNEQDQKEQSPSGSRRR